MVTVRDLIDILEELPMDALVEIYDGYSDRPHHYAIVKVELDARYRVVIE